jgi:crotonobetainyl-CoA:carnitine CoA-transferase CaiB-like acyl-CoA transferase
MADAAATLTSTSALLAAGGHFDPRRLGAESPLAVPSSVFKTGDGKEIQVICVTERHWRSLCEAVGHPEWLADPALATNASRIANREVVRELLTPVIASDSADVWVERICAHGAICEHVRDIEEAWKDPRLQQRALVGALSDDPPWAARMPLVSLARTTTTPAPGPRLGADTEAVAQALGS